MTADFKVISDLKPVGDQPQAIEKISQGFLNDGLSEQALMGVTGSGKTFTMAHVIQKLKVPTLVLCHNKTLAAQLFGEFRDFFPENSVHYFVSYYDYYQPEAYIPQKDIYIEKDSSVNEEIDRLRLAATASLVSQEDTIVVCSVSCLYGLGSPKNFVESMLNIEVGQKLDPEQMCGKLVDRLYNRNDISCERGTFRRRGDVIEIFPSGEEAGIRVEFFGSEVERLRAFDPLTGEVLKTHQQWTLYPARHFVVDGQAMESALNNIEKEMVVQVDKFKSESKLLEANRLEARTLYDLDMIREVGYCSGIENYSRHFEDRPPGSRPFTLLDYFPQDWLLIIDESHVTLPQIQGMAHGDRSRKQTLVDHGFRLPSAIDNRPMTFDEFMEKSNKIMYVSATPGPHEKEACGGDFVEQIIRPTGLLDPQVEVRPTEGQVEDLEQEIRARIEKDERTLITTLTKRMAENLTEYFTEKSLKVRYLHSDIETVERSGILRELREGVIDVVIGVNLLREGLDLPEVSLVAIMDADKEGFLRSKTSLIQTIGRSARHIHSMVFLYADQVTVAMKEAIDETARRRKIQIKNNEKNAITPKTIQKAIRMTLEEEIRQHKLAESVMPAPGSQQEEIYHLEGEMLQAAASLDFEKAAHLRNRISELAPEWAVDGKRLKAVHSKKRSRAKSRKGRRR